MPLEVNSFIAPMKPKQIKRVASLKEWRLPAVTLVFLAFAWLGFANSAAQTQNEKSILSLRVSDEPKGSRVTVVSTLALGDYEAYRRGGRFHVKIPASEFATSQPHLRGKGFDDVQVQKDGDGIVISFKLQPGASARVDNQSNRLEVVFATVAGSTASAANKSRRLPSGLPAGAGNSRRISSQTAGANGSQQNRARRAPDVSGASPPDSSDSSTYSPQANTANSSSTSGANDQRSGSSAPAATAKSPQLSPVVKSTGSSFVQKLSRGWLLALIPLLLLLAAVLLIAAKLRRHRSTFPSVRGSKGEEVGPIESTTVDEEPAIIDSSLPILRETVLCNLPQQHIEVIAETRPALPLTSQQSATQAKLVKSTVAESSSHPSEVKEVIEELPFSDAPEFERTESEIRKLLAGQEYDVHLIDAPDSATRQFVAVSLLAALGGRPSDQHQPARKAFVDHGYFDETTRDLRTADSPAERAAAAHKLGIVGNTLGTAYLIAGLYDTAPEVRRAAVESLGQTGALVAISPLNDLLAHETSRLLPEATIRNAINSITLREGKRTTHDKPALCALEKPVDSSSRIEANDAFIEFMDAIQRHEVLPKTFASAASSTSALPPATLPENQSSITNEVVQLHLEEQALRRAAADLESRRMSAQAARQRTEEEARLKAEREAQARAEIEARIRAENEVRRRAEEEAARIKSEDEARIKAERERRARAEEETRVRAEEEARFRLEAETLRRAAQEMARKRADAEIARKRMEEEERRLAEEETRPLTPEKSQYNDDEEVHRQVEMEMRGLVEGKARHLAEPDMQKLVPNEARQPAVEALRRLWEHEALRPVGEERLLREAHERRRFEEQRLRSEQAVLIKAADEVARRRREVEEARKTAEEEGRLLIATQDRIRAEDEQRLSELEAVRQKAQDHARQRAETEKRIRAEIQALHKAEEEQRQRIEAEARRRRAAETRLREEQARRRVEEQARLKVEAEAQQSQSSRETEVANPGPIEEPAKGIDVVRLEKGLAPIGDDSDISSELLNKLNSGSSAERSVALNDLARRGGEDAFRFISSSFDDQSLDVRNAAALALYDLQPDRAATFTRALREATPDRRRKIGAALAASGLASNAIANLTGESRERTYDAFSLLFLMAKAGEVQPLIRAIEDFPNIEVRLAVVKLLALSGQPEIVPAFRRLAVRGSLPSEVRAALMEAIYQISSQTRETPAA